MNPEPDPLSPEKPHLPLEQLEANYRQLRMLFHSLAIALILLTGTVFIFLYRQVILVRRQTAQLVRYGQQIEGFGKKEVYDDLRNKLGAFARQNPDFVPIYNKYFAAPATPKPAAPSGTNRAATPGK